MAGPAGATVDTCERIDLTDPEPDVHAPSLASQLQTLVHLCELRILKPGYPLADVMIGQESGASALGAAPQETGH